jgi:predicted secreted protein
MTLESIIAIGITCASIICAPVVYIARSFMQRIDTLEATVKEKISEKEVRQIVRDKLDPIKSDLEEIKHNQEMILNHLISKKS